MFRTGTLVSPTPAPNLVISLMESDMLNVGWVKASTNVASSSYIWNVYKSPGTNNSIFTDFYVALGWDNTSNANLMITLFESWNTTTNTASQYCPNTAPTPLANATANAFPSALPNVAGSNIGYFGTGTTDSNFSQTNETYWYSITIDRVMVLTSNAASNINAGASFYAGVYESFMANTLDPVPIVLYNMGSTLAYNTNAPFPYPNYSTAGAIFTREPNQPSACTSNFYGGVTSLFNCFGQFQTLSNSTDVYTNRFLVSRGVLTGRGSSNPSTPVGVRGLIKDIWYININTPTRGDLIQFIQNGVTINAYCALGGSGWTSITLGAANPTTIRPYMANV
jgi:hypothetical protein